jgi:hypothetical protein
LKSRLLSHLHLSAFSQLPRQENVSSDFNGGAIVFSDMDSTKWLPENSDSGSDSDSDKSSSSSSSSSSDSDSEDNSTGLLSKDVENVGEELCHQDTNSCNAGSVESGVREREEREAREVAENEAKQKAKEAKRLAKETKAEAKRQTKLEKERLKAEAKAVKEKEKAERKRLIAEKQIAERAKLDAENEAAEKDKRERMEKMVRSSTFISPRTFLP